MEVAEQIENPDVIGIPSDSEFAENVPVYNHTNATGIKNTLQAWHDADDNNVNLGDYVQKANAAFEIIQRSEAVLVEIDPWFVNEHMGTNQFDRWEPFFLAFPETTQNSQMKFENLAPLSEVAYHLTKREEFAEMHEDSRPVDGDNRTASVHQQINEQRAYTRYELESHYNPDSDDPNNAGAWVDMTPIHALHGCFRPWHNHVLIGTNDTGEKYCGEGQLFDSYVDVAIDLDRRINDFGERKVAVYNDESSKDAMNLLNEKYDFDDPDSPHARYLGQKGRWEVDLNSLDTVIDELLGHESVEYVSMHTITAKAFITHIDAEFADTVHGFEEQVMN